MATELTWPPTDNENVHIRSKGSNWGFQIRF